MKLLEFLRCLYWNHWKELSVSMDHSLAVQQWIDVWVRPVLDLLTSNDTSRSLKSRLSDVHGTSFFFALSCCLSSFSRGCHPLYKLTVFTINDVVLGVALLLPQTFIGSYALSTF